MNVARVVLTLACAAPIWCSGCADQQRRPPETPSDETPVRIIPAASGAFVDTDGDRYRDSSTVVVYILADSSRYSLPMKARGEFEIRLEDSSGNLIAQWNFNKEQTAAAIRSMPPGPGFVFDLDLRKSPATGYSDRIERGEASMLVKFLPEKGDPIANRTSAPILIGPISRTPN